MSHSVTVNQDGSFTCRKPCDAGASPDPFANDLRRLMTAARLGKIEILEKTIEKFGPAMFFAVVRFKPLG